MRAVLVFVVVILAVLVIQTDGSLLHRKDLCESETQTEGGESRRSNLSHRKSHGRPARRVRREESTDASEEEKCYGTPITLKDTTLTVSDPSTAEVITFWMIIIYVLFCLGFGFYITKKRDETSQFYTEPEKRWFKHQVCSKIQSSL